MVPVTKGRASWTPLSLFSPSCVWEMEVGGTGVELCDVIGTEVVAWDCILSMKVPVVVCVITLMRLNRNLPFLSCIFHHLLP